MITINEKQLKLEIEHIFDSGANEMRVLEMVKNYINTRNQVSENESIGDVINRQWAIDFVKDGILRHERVPGKFAKEAMAKLIHNEGSIFKITRCAEIYG